MRAEHRSDQTVRSYTESARILSQFLRDYSLIDGTGTPCALGLNAADAGTPAITGTGAATWVVPVETHGTLAPDPPQDHPSTPLSVVMPELGRRANGPR